MLIHAQEIWCNQPKRNTYLAHGDDNKVKVKRKKGKKGKEVDGCHSSSGGVAVLVSASMGTIDGANGGYRRWRCRAACAGGIMEKG